MFAVVLAMVWARRGQALILAALTMVAVGAAVAAPAYLRAAARAVAAGQVAVASPAERTVQLSASRPDRRGKAAAAGDHDVTLTDSGAALESLPGFAYTYAAEMNGVSPDRDISKRMLIVYRQDVCAHLTVVAGRCLIGEADVVLGEQTARRLKLRPGDPVPLTYAKYVTSTQGSPPTSYPADGKTSPALLAGTYRVTDPQDTYWGDRHYFAPDAAGHPGEPAFVTAATFTAMDRGATRESIDGWARPGALGVDALPALRESTAALRATVTRMGAPVRLSTDLPALLARVATGTDSSRAMVAVPAVILVLLGCVTVFLAVGYGTAGRRPELAVVALRGARGGTRWWLAAGESLAAVVAGALAGCLLGQALVDIVVAVRYPGVGADPALSSLKWAPVAAVAIMVTALLAQRRHLRTPVAQLLRRAPAVPSGAVALAGLAVIALLAVVAEVQLRLTGGALAGVGTFAPALIVLALAQLAARIVLPVVSRLARAALRRGRLAAALAGFQLARRPGATALFALVVACTAVAGYTAGAVDVGAHGRRLQAELGTGAPQVLSIQAVDRSVLLSAVRAVDPDGRFAMAAATLPHDPGKPATLAVDSSRLATVPYLPAGSAPGRKLAALLHPAAAEPPTLTGPAVSLDVTATGLRPGKPVFLTAIVSSPDGHGDAVVPYDYLREGRHTYTKPVPQCRPQCRLTAIKLVEGDGGPTVTGSMELRTPSPWRSAAGAALPATTHGVRIDLTQLNVQSAGLTFWPAATPFPLPAVVAGAAPTGSVTGSVTGLDGKAVPVTTVARLSAVPSAGSTARMVDLQYAALYATDADTTSTEQVWLSADAPADISARLQAHGLTVIGSTRAATVRAQLDRQGPAVALVFYALAGVIAVVLGGGALLLAASVDRRRRTEDLFALRVQGLSRGALRRAGQATYPALVLVAGVAGTGVALLAWWLTGWALPLSTTDSHTLALPTWPQPSTIVLTGLAAVAVLATTAYLAGSRLGTRNRP